MGIGGLGIGKDRPHILADEDDNDLIEMWREKRIGRRTLQSYKDLASKSPEWLKRTGHLFGSVVQDMSTLEGREKFNPADLAGYGFMKTLQGVGVVTDTVIGKPVSFVGHNVLGLDKEVADLTGDVTEAIVTPIAAAKGVKAVQGAVGWVDDAFALASGTGVGTGAHGATGGLFKEVTRKQMLMSKLPTITTGSKEYLKLLKKATEYGKKKGNMVGFGNHYIDEKGIWRAFKWNKKTQKASVLDQGSRFDRGVRRITGEKLDDQTLLAQFGGDKKLLEQYHTTNTTIRRNLTREVKKINDAGKAKYGAKWDPIEVEHIYDVQFFWKLKNEVSKFSGSGANESINLTALRKSINQRTGAEAATLSGSDALVKNLEKFPNYNKAVREFVDFDMYNTVKNMKTADWEGLTRLVLENPNMNVHEILVNYF